MWVVGNDSEILVPMSDGTVLRGQWHESLKSKPMLLGRCVDLSKAYKQVAVATESLKHSVLGYQAADGDWHLYTTQSLPFGASASVFAFNKVSRAIWHLLVHGLHILTCVFYDDFPCFEVDKLTALTAKALDTFFNILGWKHAVQGKKATEFSLEMQALGIQYNLGELWEGKLTVQNKPGRSDRVKSLTAELRKLESGSRSIAASLAGILTHYPNGRWVPTFQLLQRMKCVK